MFDPWSGLYGLGGVATGFLLARHFRSMVVSWVREAWERRDRSLVYLAPWFLVVGVVGFTSAMLLWPLALGGLLLRRRERARDRELRNLVEEEQLMVEIGRFRNDE